MIADVPRELAEALDAHYDCPTRARLGTDGVTYGVCGCGQSFTGLFSNHQSAALLPTVQALIADAEKRAAAAALRDAAEEMSWPNSQNCGPTLRARADDLDPAGADSGEGR